MRPVNGTQKTTINQRVNGEDIFRNVNIIKKKFNNESTRSQGVSENTYCDEN